MRISNKNLFLALGLMILIPLAVHATPYQPLVRIPGLPDGGVTISSYLVALYNFFLSIVGIVAVMMLILGGMRYISSAGNSSALSDAKDMIQSAITGLFLALFSWIIISTINPDLLYIRQPGENLEDNAMRNCVGVFNEGQCTCGVVGAEGAAAPTEGSVRTTQECSLFCLNSARCPLSGLNALSRNTCIAFGSYTGTETGNYNCTCKDNSELPHNPGEDCNAVCKSARRCGTKYLVLGLKLEDNGRLPDGTYSLAEGGNMWEMFLTNNGVYGRFRVTADYYTEGDQRYTCAILVSGRASGTELMDHYNIFWVREGGIIRRNALNIWTSLGGSTPESYLTHCCSTAATDPNHNVTGDPCLVSATLTVGVDTPIGTIGREFGGCGNAEAREIPLRTRFAYAQDLNANPPRQNGVRDDCLQNNCSFAQGEGVKPSHDFWPAYDITCRNGYWEPAS